jgi:hypothetical protein
MRKMDLQREYDLIYSFFRWTTEPYDDLEWDGEVLNVWYNDEVIEKYSFRELKEHIKEL